MINPRYCKNRTVLGYKQHDCYLKQNKVWKKNLHLYLQVYLDHQGPQYPQWLRLQIVKSFLPVFLTIIIFCYSCDGGVSSRLSRESSQDILVEDIDRLSTTSAMSESSVSHRLNDVQDVQDIARMQEESEFIVTGSEILTFRFC